jgi:hypothetical protein
MTAILPSAPSAPSGESLETTAENYLVVPANQSQRTNLICIAQ